jgi:hypothetical protein
LEGASRTTVTNQDGKVVAQYDLLTLVAKKPDWSDS